MRTRTKVLAATLALALMFLLVGEMPTQADGTITVTVQLLDVNGNGIAGGQVTYVDGSWQTFGTTGLDGRVTKEFPHTTTNLRVKVTYNQGSKENTQNIQSNPVYTFQMVKATVKLIDHVGNGVQGGRVQQGGGYWQDHGYTDTNGELFVDEFPGSYKFRLTYNYVSQEKTQDISTPVIFQTGQVYSDFSGTIQATLGGGWHDFTKPSMELLPGTYLFQFGPPLSTSEQVTVVAGQTVQVPSTATTTTAITTTSTSSTTSEISTTTTTTSTTTESTSTETFTSSTTGSSQTATTTSSTTTEISTTSMSQISTTSSYITSATKPSDPPPQSSKPRTVKPTLHISLQGSDDSSGIHRYVVRADPVTSDGVCTAFSYKWSVSSGSLIGLIQYDNVTTTVDVKSDSFVEVGTVQWTLNEEGPHTITCTARAIGYPDTQSSASIVVTPEFQYTHIIMVPIFWILLCFLKKCRTFQKERTKRI